MFSCDIAGDHKHCVEPATKGNAFIDPVTNGVGLDL